MVPETPVPADLLFICCTEGQDLVKAQSMSTNSTPAVASSRRASAEAQHVTRKSPHISAMALTREVWRMLCISIVYAAGSDM
jgi:hypothetical protein